VSSDYIRGDFAVCKFRKISAEFRKKLLFRQIEGALPYKSMVFGTKKVNKVPKHTLAGQIFWD
jgi:hypothetical protein